MLEFNINKVSELINKLTSIIPTDNLLEAVIFGSSAITLYDINLERRINDLDIFVSDTDYEKLKQLTPIEELKKISKNIENKTLTLKINGVQHIEILKAFPGVNHKEVLSKASLKNHSNTLKVASIEDLVTWKTVQGRPKDVCDLIIINNYLKSLPTI